MNNKKSRAIQNAILVSALSFSVLFGTIISSYANEVDTNKSIISENVQMNNIEHENNYKPRAINPVRERYENVRKTTKYSSFKRVSRSVGRGLTASVDRGVSFSFGYSSGDYNSGFSISWKENYSAVNDRYNYAYIGIQCVYSVEKGTKVVYNAMNGKVLGRTPYEKTKFLYFRHDLIKD